MHYFRNFHTTGSQTQLCHLTFTVSLTRSVKNGAKGHFPPQTRIPVCDTCHAETAKQHAKATPAREGATVETAAHRQHHGNRGGATRTKLLILIQCPLEIEIHSLL